MNFRVSALLMITLALASGCSLLPERPARQTFMLPAPDIAPAPQQTLPLTLRVLTPHAEAPLGSTGILVNPRGQSIQTYTGARWSKPVPILVRDHWVEGLRQNGSLQAVVAENSDARSNLSLSSDLTQFQMHFPDGEPAIIIQLDVQLLETASSAVIASQRFRIEQKTDDQPVESVIAGFGEASQALTEELVAWLLQVSGRIGAETDPARPLSDTGSSTRE